MLRIQDKEKTRLVNLCDRVENFGIPARSAVIIQNKLKAKRKTIDKADLFIAAISIANDIPLATLNVKHFSQIEGLVLINTF